MRFSQRRFTKMQFTKTRFTKAVKTVFLGFAFTCVAACGNSTLDELEAAKDEICACKDKACGRKVMKEKKGLREKAKKMTNEDKLKGMKFADQAKACMAKL